MKKLRYWILLLFLVLISFSCGKKVNEREKGNKENKEEDKGQTETVIEEATFRDKEIEKVISEFTEISMKNNIETGRFEKIVFEEKNFYRAEIKVKEKSSYTIGYQGIDVIGLFLTVEVVTGADLAAIEDMVVSLILVSDTRIKEEEARNLYSEILSKMGEKELSSSVVYRNGITYGIQIGEKKGGLLFSAQ